MNIPPSGSFIPIKAARLWYGHAHIEIVGNPGGEGDIIQITPLDGGPVELFVDSDTAIEVAAQLGLESDA
jgi:hypothetical protein